MSIHDVMTRFMETLAIELFSVRGIKISIGSLAVVFAIGGITHLLSRLSRRAIRRFFAKKELKDQANSEILQRVTQYLIIIAGIVAALQVFGIDLSTLFAAGAIFAVGFGFAMQNIAQNFVSGVILLIERTIKPGDVLEVEGKVVRVSRMGIRSTVSRTLNDEDIILPNSVLVQTTVKNYTMQDSIYRLRAGVGVTYSSDLALVRKTLEEVARNIPWRLKSREPRILLRQFGSSSVDYELSVWVDHPWRAYSRLSELNEAIWWAFKEKNITIAFPQLDLHLDPPVTDGISGLSRLGSNGSGAPRVG